MVPDERVFSSKIVSWSLVVARAQAMLPLYILMPQLIQWPDWMLFFLHGPYSSWPSQSISEFTTVQSYTWLKRKLVPSVRINLSTLHSFLIHSYRFHTFWSRLTLAAVGFSSSITWDISSTRDILLVHVVSSSTDEPANQMVRYLISWWTYLTVLFTYHTRKQS